MSVLMPEQIENSSRFPIFARRAPSWPAFPQYIQCRKW